MDEAKYEDHPLVCKVSAMGKGEPRCNPKTAFTAVIKENARVQELRTLSDGSSVAVIEIANNKAKYGSGRNFVMAKITSALKLDDAFNHNGISAPIIADSCKITEVDVRGLWVNEKTKRATVSINRCVLPEQERKTRPILNRFDLSGELDEAFGTKGILIPNLRTFGSILSTSVDSDDKVVILSSRPFDPGEPNNLILARFTK